jgi:hypothetical protein
MTLTDKPAHRLALLDGVDISPADLEAIAKEIEDNLRVVAVAVGCASDLPKSTNFLSHHADSVCAGVGIVRQV